MLNYLIILAMIAHAQNPPAQHHSPVHTVKSGLEVEVPFHGAGGVQLTGTLELPKAHASACKALLLLPGSGPTDRDGNSSIAGFDQINTLKDIADMLASEGIASYRFDKRAIRRYQALWPKDLGKMGEFFSYNKFVGDAEAAYKMLQNRPEIDPKRIGVLGHSEGGTFALQVGADLKPAGLVLLATMGRKMGAVLHDQIAFRIGLQAPQLVKTYTDYTDAACEAMASGKPLPPNPPQGLNALFNPTTVDLLGPFCRLDPVDLIKAYSGPVLIMNGEYDLQVSPTKDFPRLLEALKNRPSSSVVSFIVPKASHVFKTARTPTSDAFEGPMVPAVLTKIGDFAKQSL